MEPRDVISAIAAPTGDLGSAFYFHPDTVARGKEIGLDGFRFYFLGRGGVLGDVEPDVVVSAFGYFQPGLVAKIWNTAKERVAPREAAREYLACNAVFGRKRFADIDDSVLAAYGDAAAQVVAAVDVSGLTLFAGIRSESVPDDPAGRAIHHAVLLRELRGSTHLLAVRASGLDSPVAHAMKRPDDMATFGWSEVPTITDDHRAALDRAEALTDEMLVTAFSVLDDGAAEALVAGTEAMHATLTS